MAPEEFPCFIDFAAAFVRGTALQGTALPLAQEQVRKSFDFLSGKDKADIVAAGIRQGLRLHRFKRLHVFMPRVRRTLGFLQGVLPESLLDIGSGRGAFLWPCLDAFPDLPVTAMDLDPRRAELYETVRRGGIERLHGIQGDVRKHDFGGQTFDVVTLLEVLEHLEHPEQALNNLRPVARRHLVISVPSKEDDNPGHIHLFTQAALARLLRDAGFDKFHFDHVPGHLFVFVSLGGTS